MVRKPSACARSSLFSPVGFLRSVAIVPPRPPAPGRGSQRRGGPASSGPAVPSTCVPPSLRGPHLAALALPGRAEIHDLAALVQGHVVAALALDAVQRQVVALAHPRQVRHLLRLARPAQPAPG